MDPLGHRILGVIGQTQRSIQFEILVMDFFALVDALEVKTGAGGT